MKHFRTRLMLIIAMILVTFFFSSDFSLIDIQKTAIIVAIGIDKADEGVEVTAQIAVPQASDQTSANNDSVVSAKGATVVDAINNIGIKTGWQPKMAFCDLILLGDSIVSDNVMTIVSNMLSSLRIQKSAILAACEKNAKDALLATTPLDAISSFAIQKILFKNVVKANNVSNIDIRTFAKMSLSHSQASFMPLIKEKKTDEKSKDGTSSSQMAALSDSGSGGSSGGGSSGGGSGGEEKTVEFEATSTVVFSNGKRATILDENETLVYNLLIKDVGESFIDVERNGEKILMAITRNNNNFKVSFAEKPQMIATLKLNMGIADKSNGMEISEITRVSLLDQELIEICEKKFVDILDSVAKKLTESEADLFGAKNYIYKFKHKKYDDLKDLSIKNYIFVPNVTVKSIG